MESLPKAPSTLYDKIWENHIVFNDPEGENNTPKLIYVDRHLVHEVSSPQAFDGLWSAKRSVRRPDCTLATADHNVPTTPRSGLFTADSYIRDAQSRAQYTTLEKNVRRARIPYYGLRDNRQGIVHVIGGEQGFVLPGTVAVCGDSHTSTLGAFGALAFGIGTSEVEHVLATQTLRLRKSKNMLIKVTGTLGIGVTSKDLILHIIRTIGTAGGTGYVIEYAGEVVRGLSMEARMTMCNMTIEAGARAGLVAPDEITFEYLRGRPMVPKEGEMWDKAVEFWRGLKSDEGAKFDKEVVIRAEDIEPTVTWGTSPEDNAPITGFVPDPKDIEDPRRRDAVEKSLGYMDLKAGMKMEDVTIDKVFIGSCTNSRITDLRSASKVLLALGSSARVSPSVHAMVVPGSGVVKRQAEEEGLDVIFKRAGFDWREAGCSMCIGLNPDQLGKGERCASTSNRNFRDRQGTGGRTHLVSPAMAVAAAIHGRLVDVRKLVELGKDKPNEHGAEAEVATKKTPLHPTLFGGSDSAGEGLTTSEANVEEEGEPGNDVPSRQSRQLISVLGVAAPLQMENIDTDMLIPAPLVKGLTRTGFAFALFNRFRFDSATGQDTDFILNRDPWTKAKIVVCSGANFGCGSSREHAVWALKDFGISCVIAPSYGDIFFNNCLQNGVLLVTLPRSTCQTLVEYASTGGEMSVDLVKEEIKCLSSGLVVPFKTDPINRERLLKGTDDIDMTLGEKDKIEKYEEMRRELWGWLELNGGMGGKKIVGSRHGDDLSW